MKQVSARRARQIRNDMAIHGPELYRYPLYRAIADAIYSPRLTINAGMDRAEKERPFFSGTEEAQEFLRTVQRSEYVRKNFPRTHDADPVVVGENSWGGGVTHPETRRIDLHPDGMGMSKYAALHEFAHLVIVYEKEMYDSGLFFRGDKYAAHGPVFANVHLRVIQEFMPEKGAALRRAYKRHNVKMESM